MVWDRQEAVDADIGHWMKWWQGGTMYDYFVHILQGYRALNLIKSIYYMFPRLYMILAEATKPMWLCSTHKPQLVRPPRELGGENGGVEQDVLASSESWYLTVSVTLAEIVVVASYSAVCPHTACWVAMAWFVFDCTARWHGCTRYPQLMCLLWLPVQSFVTSDSQPIMVC